MRSLVVVPLVAIAIASGATAYAQAPSTGSGQAAKPATGSTGSTAATGQAKPQTPATGTTAAKPATGPSTGSGQAAKPATGGAAATGSTTAAKPATASTGSTTPAKPATGTATPTPQPKPPAAPTPPPAAPTPAPATPQTGRGAAPPPLPPPSSEAYTYQTEGRRDPFLQLVGATLGPGPVASNPKLGPSGMTVAEIQVRGIVQSRGSLLAMILGSDNKTYIVHQGDKLADGTIKQITPQGLVILQEVNDPLSLVKQRVVRKLLRSLEDAK